MNKVEIVASLAEKAGLTKQEAEKAFDSLFDILIDSLAEGEKDSLGEDQGRGHHATQPQGRA